MILTPLVSGLGPLEFAVNCLSSLLTVQSQTGTKSVKQGFQVTAHTVDLPCGGDVETQLILAVDLQLFDGLCEVMDALLVVDTELPAEAAYPDLPEQLKALEYWECNWRHHLSQYWKLLKKPITVHTIKSSSMSTMYSPLAPPPDPQLRPDFPQSCVEMVHYPHQEVQLRQRNNIIHKFTWICLNET